MYIAIGYIWGKVDMTIRQCQFVIIVIGIKVNIYLPSILTDVVPIPPLTLIQIAAGQCDD